MNFYKKLKENYLKFSNKLFTLICNASKKAKMVFLLGCGILSSGAFAAGELDTAADNLLNIIAGKPLKVVLVLAVICCFGVIAWGQSQGEGGMFKKVLPVIIGLIGVASASTIVSTFYKSQITVTAQLLNPTPIFYEIPISET